MHGIIAKHPGVCKRCRGTILQGDVVWRHRTKISVSGYICDTCHELTHVAPEDRNPQGPQRVDRLDDQTF